MTFGIIAQCSRHDSNVDKTLLLELYLLLVNRASQSRDEMLISSVIASKCCIAWKGMCTRDECNLDYRYIMLAVLKS